MENNFPAETIKLVSYSYRKDSSNITLKQKKELEQLINNENLLTRISENMNLLNMSAKKNGIWNATKS